MKVVIRYLLFFAVCVFFSPIVASAECDYSRMAELNKIASNVQFSYSYEIDDKGIPRFSVNISNIINDIYILDEYGNTFNSDTVKQYSFKNSVNYLIYSNDVNCKNEKLLNKTVTFPNYNIYSKLKECQENSGFELCSNWLSNSSIYSENDFYLKLKEYKRQNDFNNNTNNIEKVDFSNIIFIGLITITIVILIFLVVRRIKNA